MLKTYLLTITALVYLVTVGYASVGSKVHMVTPNVCAHGLVPQPPGGPFSVFVFCDDGLGTNIGVILTEAGSGPGKINLGPSRIWPWDRIDRFWQEPHWSGDVSHFLWSPSLRYLYVATAPIYGTGHLYELDLLTKTTIDLCPDCYDSEIVGIDESGRSFEVKLTIGTSEKRKLFLLQ